MALPGLARGVTPQRNFGQKMGRLMKVQSAAYAGFQNLKDRFNTVFAQTPVAFSKPFDGHADVAHTSHGLVLLCHKFNFRFTHLQ